VQVPSQDTSDRHILSLRAEYELSSLELARQGHERPGSSVRESCLPRPARVGHLWSPGRRYLGAPPGPEMPVRMRIVNWTPHRLTRRLSGASRSPRISTFSTSACVSSLRFRRAIFSPSSGTRASLRKFECTQECIRELGELPHGPVRSVEAQVQPKWPGRLSG
jgi:hypothetical protein